MVGQQGERQSWRPQVGNSWSKGRGVPRRAGGMSAKHRPRLTHRLWKPNGMRLPSTFCCPTHPIICEMLMLLPLLPAVTILMMLLVRSTDMYAALPASSRHLFRIWFTCDGKRGVWTSNKHQGYAARQGTRACRKSH